MSASTSRCARCAVVSAAVVLCGAAASAQEASVQLDARLLERLRAEASCPDAMRALTRRGAEAVPLLTKAFTDARTQNDELTCLRVVFTIGRLGDAGAGAADVLCDAALDARGDLAKNLYWALAEVGPAADVGRGRLLGRLQQHRPAVGPVHMEWVFACRCIEVGPRCGTRELVTLLECDDHASHVAAAAVLCRMPVGTDVPREALLARWQETMHGWRACGDDWFRQAMALSRAVARHCGRCEQVVEANRALVYHFDFEVRMTAAMQLGQDPGKDLAATVRALVDALTDGWVSARREAVTSLGMLGPAAADAKEPLAGLAADDPDPQVRARAARALRAIGGQR